MKKTEIENHCFSSTSNQPESLLLPASIMYMMFKMIACLAFHLSIWTATFRNHEFEIGWPQNCQDTSTSSAINLTSSQNDLLADVRFGFLGPSTGVNSSLALNGPTCVAPCAATADNVRAHHPREHLDEQLDVTTPQRQPSETTDVLALLARATSSTTVHPATQGNTRASSPKITRTCAAFAKKSTTDVGLGVNGPIVAQSRESSVIG